jgi:DNA primase
MAQRLNRSAQGGAREALAVAVIAGLMRYPGQIARHADALVRTPGLDPRFDLLLDASEAGARLENETITTIFESTGLTAPTPADYARIPWPFLRDGADASKACEALAAAVAMLTEEPALDAAIAAATERFDLEEQARLRQRKLFLAERLREVSQGPGEEGKVANTI